MWLERKKMMEFNDLCVIKENGSSLEELKITLNNKVNDIDSGVTVPLYMYLPFKYQFKNAESLQCLNSENPPVYIVCKICNWCIILIYCIILYPVDTTMYERLF